jgi:hypothetical protein
MPSRATDRLKFRGFSPRIGYLTVQRPPRLHEVLPVQGIGTLADTLQAPIRRVSHRRASGVHLACIWRASRRRASGVYLTGAHLACISLARIWSVSHWRASGVYLTGAHLEYISLARIWLASDAFGVYLTI